MIKEKIADFHNPDRHASIWFEKITNELTKVIYYELTLVIEGHRISFIHNDEAIARKGYDSFCYPFCRMI